MFGVEFQTYLYRKTTRVVHEATPTSRRSSVSATHETHTTSVSFDFGENLSIESSLSFVEHKLAEIRDIESMTRTSKSMHPYSVVDSNIF
jgi:hypothetical protein